MTDRIMQLHRWWIVPFAIWLTLAGLFPAVLAAQDATPDAPQSAELPAEPEHTEPPPPPTDPPGMEAPLPTDSPAIEPTPVTNTEQPPTPEPPLVMAESTHPTAENNAAWFPVIGEITVARIDCGSGVVRGSVEVSSVEGDLAISYTGFDGEGNTIGPGAVRWSPPDGQTPFTGTVPFEFAIDGLATAVTLGIDVATGDFSSTNDLFLPVDCVTPPTDAPATDVPPIEVPPTAESTATPDETGSVTVTLEPANLPDGAELCLVSDADEFCNPATGVVERSGIRGFAQPTTVNITFSDVPPGRYQVVLRAPGFRDLVLDQLFLDSGQPLEIGPITAAEQERIQPIGSLATPAPTGTLAPGGETCASPEDRSLLALLDSDDNGVMTIAELESQVDTLPEGDFRNRFVELLDGAAAAGVTGYRYDAAGPCAPTTIEPAPTSPAPTEPPVLEPTIEPTEPAPTAVPNETGSVAVDIDSDGLPAGSQLCLVNEDTAEERCEPIPEAGAVERPGILAFRQAASITITFENVPAGTWRLILRATGFEDLVIANGIAVTANQESYAGAVPPDIAERLEPATPPGPITIDALIRLLIAILIQIFISLGIR